MGGIFSIRFRKGTTNFGGAILQWLRRVSKFVRDQKSEIKKIVWPGKKQVVNNTAVVIGFVLVAAVVVGVFDAALAAVVSLLLGS